jgi:D-3-phosphoglycerate dehydrogenase
MKILVACELPAFALEELGRLGAEVAYEPQLSASQLPQRIGDVSILVVDQVPVSPEAIDRGRALQMIVCAGAGRAHVAVDEASAQGIFVTSCPHRDAVAQAELALGLMLALDRDIADQAVLLREGCWERGRFLDAAGLAGRTLGVLGTGSFCRALAERALALEMNILAWVPEGHVEALEGLAVELCNWPRELARRSEVVVVHTPAGLGMEQVANGDLLDCLGQGALFVHLGDVTTFDEDGLVAAVQERGVRVALDVFRAEPTTDSGRLRSRVLALPGVIGTHHVAGVTAQARAAVAREVVRIVSAFLISGEVLGCLNLCERSPATWQLVLRLRDQVGVMAAVLDAIRADGINAQEISSRVFVGAKAAWCTIALDERPSTEALKAIQALGDVLHFELRAVV